MATPRLAYLSSAVSFAWAKKSRLVRRLWITCYGLYNGNAANALFSGIIGGAFANVGFFFKINPRGTQMNDQLTEIVITVAYAVIFIAHLLALVKGHG